MACVFRYDFASAMAVSDSYREFVLEQLGRIQPVTSRRMFGGVGLYADGLFFALLDNDTLFFKVDEATRPAFEAEGMKPFQPFGDGTTPMAGYYEVPADVLERSDRLSEWMRRAIEVARAAAMTKRAGSGRARATPTGAVKPDAKARSSKVTPRTAGAGAGRKDSPSRSARRSLRSPRGGRDTRGPSSRRA